MLRLYLNNTLFYSFNEAENTQNMMITSLNLKKELNTLSSLSFSIYDVHPRFSELRPKKSLIVLHDSNLVRSLFVGKVRTVRRSVISGTVNVDCEELLGCLRDSVLIDDKFYDDEKYIYTEHPPTFKYTYRRMIHKALDGIEYNTSVDNLPNISEQIQTDNLLDNLSNTSLLGVDRLSVLYSNVSSYTGGIFRFVPHGSGNTSTYTSTQMYLQYLTEIRDAARDSDGYLEPLVEPDPSFESGINIIEVDIEPTQEDPTTGILPYGAFDEIPDATEGANDRHEERQIRVGETYKTNDYIIYDVDSRNRFGKIVKAIDFGKDPSTYVEVFDQTSPVEAQLYSRAKAWADYSFKIFCDKLSVTGIDKYYIKPSDSPIGRPIDLGDIVRVRMPNYISYMYGKMNEALDYTDYCLSLDIDYFNHENDRYVIGPYIPNNLLDYKVTDVIAKNNNDAIRSSKHFNNKLFK